MKDVSGGYITASKGKSGDIYFTACDNSTGKPIPIFDSINVYEAAEAYDKTWHQDFSDSTREFFRNNNGW